MKVFELINKKSPWKDDTSSDVIVAKAKLAVSDLTAAGNFTKVKLIYRVAGQSGSGKTTQLLPTILKYETLKGRTPIIIGVRSFVKYHPHFDEIKKTMPQGKIREATNGFALKCLCAAYKQLLEKGYLVVLDLTIMEPWFEKPMLANAQKNNYTVEYHIMAINKELSNSFIQKRQADPAHPEYGKIVNVASSNYWYDALPHGVEFLARNDKKNLCTIWSAFDLHPIYNGELTGAPAALKIGRSLRSELVYTEDELRNGKLEFINSAKQHPDDTSPYN